METEQVKAKQNKNSNDKFIKVFINRKAHRQGGTEAAAHWCLLCSTFSRIASPRSFTGCLCATTPATSIQVTLSDVAWEGV